MNTFKYAYKNLWRNRRRTIITMVAIGFGLFLAIMFVTIAISSYSQMINMGVKSGSGNLSVYHDSYLKLRKNGLYFNEGQLASKIKKVKGVSNVLTRLYIAGAVSSPAGMRAAMITGIDFKKEQNINPLVKMFLNRRITFGINNLAANFNFNAIWQKLCLAKKNFKLKGNKIIIGAKLLHHLHVRVGQKLILQFQNANKQLTEIMVRVGGMVSTGITEVDSSLIFIDKTFLQKQFGKTGAIHELAILMKQQKADFKAFSSIKKIVASSGQIIKLYDWEQAMPDLSSGIKMDYFSQQIMMIVIMIIIGIGVINTLLMSVMERMKEFGVLKAVGASSFTIWKLVLSEAFVLGVISVGIGIFLGFIWNAYLVYYGLNVSALMGNTNLEYGGVIMDPLIHGIWAFKDIARYSGIMFAICLFAGIYPAYRANKITPVKALSFE